MLFSLSMNHTTEQVLVLVACHIGARKAQLFSDPKSIPGKSPGKILGKNPKEFSQENSREDSGEMALFKSATVMTGPDTRG